MRQASMQCKETNERFAAKKLWAEPERSDGHTVAIAPATRTAAVAMPTTIFLITIITIVAAM